MDIGDTLAPDSTQLDAVDLVAGERTFTVKNVKVSAGEQPVEIYFEEFDRPWRPGKNMRRVITQVWGKHSSEYAGRRIALFCDTRVVFGGKPVGGIRIRAMSHINEPQSVLVLISQGKTAFYRVDPLVEAAQSAPAEPPSMPERINFLVAEYHRGGVSQQQLEAKVARPCDEWDESNVADLEALMGALKARQTTKDAEFDTTGADA